MIGFMGELNGEQSRSRGPSPVHTIAWKFNNRGWVLNCWRNGHEMLIVQSNMETR